jgi:preprotein translocase subunit YajC
VLGTTYLAVADKAAAKTSGGFTELLLFMVLLFGIFYFVMIRPQRARQRAAAQKQTEARPGSRVRTTAGIYGTLVSGDDRDVVIEIAPGVEITMLRRGIMEVLPDDYPAGPSSENLNGQASTDDEAEADDGPADEVHADDADEVHADDANDAAEDVSAGDSGDRAK